MTPRPRKQYLRLDIVAARFGYSVKTIRRWARAGKLPAMKLHNGYWAVDATALEKIPSPSRPKSALRH